MAKSSAAYIVVIVSIIAFIIGTLLLTATDPVMQALFGSQMWGAETQDGKNLLKWMSRLWAFFSSAILIAIVMEIWIGTRQPT